MGRISCFSTLLTGEMANAQSGHTILADAVCPTDEAVEASTVRGAIRIYEWKNQ